MLSRKYYVLIAKAIKDNRPLRTLHQVHTDNLINDLCREFKRDNGLFNIDRFVDACE